MIFVVLDNFLTLSLLLYSSYPDHSVFLYKGTHWKQYGPRVERGWWPDVPGVVAWKERGWLSRAKKKYAARVYEISYHRFIYIIIHIYEGLCTHVDRIAKNTYLHEYNNKYIANRRETKSIYMMYRREVKVKKKRWNGIKNDVILVLSYVHKLMEIYTSKSERSSKRFLIITSLCNYIKGNYRIYKISCRIICYEVGLWYFCDL